MMLNTLCLKKLSQKTTLHAWFCTLGYNSIADQLIF